MFPSLHLCVFFFFGPTFVVHRYSLVATPEPKKKDGNKRGGGGYDEPGAPDGKQDPAAPAVIRCVPCVAS